MLSWLNGWRNRLHIRQAVKNGLQVGCNVRIMGGCSFGSEPYLIKIGNNVVLSFGVAFITHDGGTWIFRDEAEYRGITRYGPIRIDDGCFIGARSTILPGVHIGKRSLIGAGSVVINGIPSDAVAAGVPARILMTRKEYIDKCVDEGQRVPPQEKQITLTKMFGEFLK